ncbi:hypothetical protein O181_048841 [Austropuccinia psidii MF-1]|uniref:Uncharacterized protein n=1 Tax=Austropuccinia psidii MF-1 TaxID=1389203 RepID=A0A9Q3HKS8_9BASI|nr:hypothetical protein [Austropuccinia psidii MF-1]
MSQPGIITPLNGCCGNSSWSPGYGQLAIKDVYGQLYPFGALWPIGGNTPPPAKYGPRPYPAFIGQFSTLPIPKPLSFFWAWGPFQSSRDLWPL